MTNGQQYRVDYACRVILRGGNATRAFDNCFEMGDGSEVAAKVYRRALKNPKLMQAMPNYLDMAMCRADHDALFPTSARGSICKTPILSDADTGKRIRFEPVRVPGKGWSVAKVIGSKRTGRRIERAEGFEDVDGYTMHQAQMAAENLARDTFLATTKGE